MKRVLVLYATREGQTRKIAVRIAKHLQDLGTRVQLADAADTTQVSTLDLAKFDLLVFGASMHAGGLEEELVTYVNGHRQQIEAMPRSLFLVLLSAATKDAELRARWLADAAAKLNRQLRVRFEDIETIAGALTYSKYSLPLKWLMKRIARQAGEATDTSKDYEYTDWEQVETYAQRLAKA